MQAAAVTLAVAEMAKMEAEQEEAEREVANRVRVKSEEMEAMVAALVAAMARVLDT